MLCDLNVRSQVVEVMGSRNRNLMSRSPQTWNPGAIKMTYLGYFSFLTLFCITHSEGLWHSLDFNK